MAYDRNLNGFKENFWGADLWLSTGRLCIHPYRIYDPGTRTIPKSSGISQKQSIAIRRIGLSWGGGSCYTWYFFLEVLLLCAPPFLILCPVPRKHWIVFGWWIGECSWGGVAATCGISIKFIEYRWLEMCPFIVILCFGSNPRQWVGMPSWTKTTTKHTGPSLYGVERNVSSWKGEICNTYESKNCTLKRHNVKMRSKLNPKSGTSIYLYVHRT